MSVDIIIPWRDSGCPARKRALDFVYGLYESHFSNIILCDSSKDEFNRAEARNAGVRKSTADIVVVTDADLFVPVSQIEEAIVIAETFDGQIKPFTAFGHLSEASTQYFLAKGDYASITEAQFDTLSTLWPGVHGGTFVMRRELWDPIGGMDEAFTGWGGEDNAFNILCSSKLKEPLLTLDGYAFHLFHPHRRRMSRENALLLESYRKKYQENVSER